MPKIGEKRSRGKCSFCGAKLFEIYSSFPAYHNDSEERWELDKHGKSSCIKFLNIRLKRLEKIR